MICYMLLVAEYCTSNRTNGSNGFRRDSDGSDGGRDGSDDSDGSDRKNVGDDRVCSMRYLLHSVKCYHRR